MAEFQDVARFLDDISTWLIPGADCIIYHKGKQVFRHQAGYADVEAKTPLTSDHLFFLYSASKMITCTAALQLFERGKFLLTDPVSAYLPEFSDMTVLRQTDGKTEQVKAKNQITVGQLFSMTAGLNYELDTPEIRAVREKTDGKCPTREVVKAIAEQPLSFEPGTHWQYSLCHDVLGALIEVVSGQQFGQYLQEHIFDPLGMRRTGFAYDSVVESKMAQQYEYKDELNRYVRVELKNRFRLGSEYESGGAGLISCADDYILFANALCNGGSSAAGERILSRRTIDLMRTNHLDAVSMQDFDWPHLTGYGYGLGVRTMVDRARGGSLGPVGEFGWDGAAGAYALVDPENQIAVFYIQHMLNGKHPYIHPRLRNIVYQCLS